MYEINFSHYAQYTNSMCISGSPYQQDVEQFINNYTKEGYFYTLQDFFDYLERTKKLNESYRTHFEQYLNQSLSSGFIDFPTYTIQNAVLNFFYTKSNYSEKNGVSAEYEENNFLQIDEEENPKEYKLLQQLMNKGYSIWLNNRGNVCIKSPTQSSGDEHSLSQASIIISNILNMDIELIKGFSNEKKKKQVISTNSLIFVQEKVLDTKQNKEFFQIDGVWYRNIFKPSRLLQLNHKPENVPIYIFSLMSHLVNYDTQRLSVFINWLAYFVQTLQKPQIALLFKGRQGAGKGTFFKIMSKIYGESYCKQINGDSLKSNYLGSFIENTLLINFDEVSYKTIGKKSFMSFLKGLITNNEVTAEKKGINMSNATKANAQVVLFSNDENPIEIEENDRRFTVFTTAGNLQETNFFGLGSFDLLEEKINAEIEDFAMYLKAYIIDAKAANRTYETIEKSLMVNSTANNLQWLVQAIFNYNWQYFDSIRQINIALYNIFIKQLMKHRVFQKHLILVYKALYPNDNFIVSAKTLIKHLEQIAPEVFGEHNLYKTNGDKYYKLMLEDIDEPVVMPNIQYPALNYQQTLY